MYDHETDLLIRLVRDASNDLMKLGQSYMTLNDGESARKCFVTAQTLEIQANTTDTLHASLLTGNPFHLQTETMTSNDLGHINNLGRAHTNALKKTWRSLIEAISKETSLSGKYIADSVYVDELFRAMGYDNPDVLILRWLRSRKWDVNASVHQMIETMKWRRDWGVQELVAKGERAISQDEISTNKTYFMGHDKMVRP
ncbi:unnamed protein product, partial [Adineta steineri]